MTRRNFFNAEVRGGICAEKNPERTNSPGEIGQVYSTKVFYNERTLSTARPWLDKLRRKRSVIRPWSKLLYNFSGILSHPAVGGAETAEGNPTQRKCMSIVDALRSSIVFTSAFPLR
jgi:hypothetical protein